MKEYLKKINQVLWVIPSTTRKNMKVPAHIYASEDMLEMLFKDKSLEQLMNVTTLPGIQSHALVMPDVHEGYGFPIGAVVATDYEDGVISPGGIGYDINCGIRILKSNFDVKRISKDIEKISSELYKQVPSGVGRGGNIKLSIKEMDNVLYEGCRWAVSQGYATQDDLRFIESNGSMTSANPNFVSILAKERGRDQLGTMGAGNHFVEIDYIQKIYDEKVAQAFGLFQNQVVIQIHTGSRGLGHQVATDYIKNMITNLKSFGIELPDKELSCAPISSDLGKEYFSAMSASANYAWTNRQLITHLIREGWRNIFGKRDGQLDLLYDVAHNIAKIEEHLIDGKKKKVIVHRKGATRAFPANHIELPSEFKKVGQPVLIPGSMGSSSYILVGLPENLEKSFGSSCHGSGRTMSRTAALKKYRGDKLKSKLKNIGITIQTGSLKGLAEEAPEAYKDVDSVVEVVETGLLAKRVAKLKPLAVIKG